MANIKPFCAVRPANTFVKEIAALPYDVYSREEAVAVIAKHPDSFLKIDRPETNFSKNISFSDSCVYQTAGELLSKMIKEKKFIQDKQKGFYIYRLIMDGRSQTGLVGCASIDDYNSSVIMKHENTRSDKEQDRVNHIKACNAQTGPIFLSYKQDPLMQEILEKNMEKTPIYDFNADDNITHTIWHISEEQDILQIEQIFSNINKIYIADGHHRCAAAVKVGMEMRKPNCEQESDFFLSVLFADDQLKIFDYNRVIKDLNGNTNEGILSAVSQKFDLSMSDIPVSPKKKGDFGMYLDHQWYLLSFKGQNRVNNPVESLDVSILQTYILEPVFQITNPKTDQRIDFVGGIRGLGELERRVHTDCKIAFSMFPTSIEELFSVADAHQLMPPKSTWFEPKLRSGLFIHLI